MKSYHLESCHFSSSVDGWSDTVARVYENLPPESLVSGIIKDEFLSEFDLIRRIASREAIFIVKWIHNNKKLIYAFVREDEAKEYLNVLAQMVSIETGSDKVVLQDKGVRNVYRLMQDVENNKTVSFNSQGHQYQLFYWKLI